MYILFKKDFVVELLFFCSITLTLPFMERNKKLRSMLKKQGAENSFYTLYAVANSFNSKILETLSFSNKRALCVPTVEV
jgi:hypothetical protein